jgi:hypothetical protein
MQIADIYPAREAGKAYAAGTIVKRGENQWSETRLYSVVRRIRRKKTAVATVGTSSLLGEVNWPFVLFASLLAGILSMLTSVGGLPELKE